MSTFKTEFTLRPGDAREVDDAAVRAYDAALARALGAEPGSLMHALDPRRIQKFEAGGPPVWSVAFASSPKHGFDLHLTYGLSGALDLDPARQPLTYELAIAVPTAQSGMWPALLLRALARYILTSRRHLEVGHHLDMGAPISKAPVAPAEQRQMPDTALTVAAIVADPALPVIQTPRGEVEVRRVVGLHADELRLAEPWSVAGIAGAIGAAGNLNGVTDLRRPSFASDPRVRRAAEEGSKREGASFGALPMNGVRWAREGNGFVIELPGGADARRIKAMIEARLPFGRTLLVHGFTNDPQAEIGFRPSDDFYAQEVDGMLELGIPDGHPALIALTQDAPKIVWRIGGA